MRILFVCMGNICRSPTAEGVMARVLAEQDRPRQIEIDSAGTGAWHVGQPADQRSRAAARRRGIELHSVARQFTPRDFDDFDLILAADLTNRRDLLRLAGDDELKRAKVRLLREFDPDSVARGELEVPDPYYGDGDGFERVLDICDAACRGLLTVLPDDDAGSGSVGSGR